jgi:hypothetical protein
LPVITAVETAAGTAGRSRAYWQAIAATAIIAAMPADKPSGWLDGLVTTLKIKTAASRMKRGVSWTKQQRRLSSGSLHVHYLVRSFDAMLVLYTPTKAAYSAVPSEALLERCGASLGDADAFRPSLKISLGLGNRGCRSHCDDRGLG